MSAYWCIEKSPHLWNGQSETLRHPKERSNESLWEKKKMIDFPLYAFCFCLSSLLIIMSHHKDQRKWQKETMARIENEKKTTVYLSANTETEVTWCCHGQLIYSVCLLQHNWIPIFQTNVWLLWHNVINFMVFSSFAPIIGAIKSNFT